jgi:predicted molibdopterin-dependent oxidoreductase YjgC
LSIIAAVGERLGVPMPPGNNPRLVMEEISRVVPQYGGVSFSRLDMTEFIDEPIPMPAAVSYKQLRVKSLMWPCPTRLDPGSPILYADGFATPSGKARLWSAKALQSEASQLAPQVQPQGTLMATLGFLLFPFKTGTLSRHSYGLSRVEPTPRLHINSRDAARLGIGDLMPVQVEVVGAADSAGAADAAGTIFAVSLVYDSLPEGRAFLGITLEQTGTNEAVRNLRHMIMTDNSGERKAVPVRVTAAPNRAGESLRELQPVATANLLNTDIQPL